MNKLTGMSHTRIYLCWARMKGRCLNPNNKDYKHYGGRGITICDEWLDVEFGFTNFYYWAMENGYTDELTIDRIDVNGNYESSNCRWATILEQRNNMRSNVVLTYKGKSMNLKQWSNYLGIGYSAICDRWHRGYTVDKILDTNVRCSVRYVDFDGKHLSVHDWAELFGIKQDTLSARLKRANYNMELVYNRFSDMQVAYSRQFRDNQEN